MEAAATWSRVIPQSNERLVLHSSSQHCSLPSLQIGPGLATTYQLQFTPEALHDYAHALLCETERERFTVPVRAVGARALLDLPDLLHFPPSPVKHPASRTLLVRNIGSAQAKFSLHTNK